MDEDEEGVWHSVFRSKGRGMKLVTGSELRYLVYTKNNKY